MPKKTLPQKKRNIAVIGGGTGGSLAWFIDQSPEFNVTLFEKNERLGGHINTLELNGVKVEGGAEFIGGPALYPRFHRLLKYLKIPLKTFELSMDFEDLRTNKHVVMPPIYEVPTGEGKKSKSNLLNCFGLFCSGEEIKVSFHTLFNDLLELINMDELINNAKKHLLNSDEVLTLEQFAMHSFCGTETYKKRFAHEFLYPLIAAAWGAPVDAIKDFCAHYAMNYLTADTTWYEAPNGLSSYIDKLQSRSKNTEFQLNTEIKRIIPVMDEGKEKYKLLKQDDTFVVDEDGEVILYDDVAITTAAEVTAELLRDLPKVQELQNLLAQVEYYDTTIVFHQDPAYRSPNHTVVHTRFDGVHAANTMCKEWHFPEGEVPIMKTWVLPGQPMPQNVLHTVNYRHPKMDDKYYAAQQALHRAQGEYGLWFGGILAGFNDSHESGITASINIATQLCTQEHCLDSNTRLKIFENTPTEGIEEINDNVARPSNAYA
ncbi:MAG: FAD-dependent oxidoreductase [Legionella sp.]|uniref:FAD-dependent oxidoreductase n=1 Tax=Legionella sp. TaxID=459 RepID=UPI00285104AF|nr:FAD-dependent oxidoreductase [Legionella sp.]